MGEQDTSADQTGETGIAATPDLSALPPPTMPPPAPAPPHVDGGYVPPYAPPPPPGYPPAVAYPYPPGPYPTPYPTMQPRTSGFAIAALVLGILWLYWVGSVLALIFGYIAKSQINRSNGQLNGRGMAIAGIVLGWIGIGVLLLLFVIGIAAGLSGP